MAAATAGGSAPGGSESEGEEQEDPSSSHEPRDLSVGLEELSLENNEEDKVFDDELSMFREKWQKELVSPQRKLFAPVHQSNDKQQDEEQRAKELFLKGVEMERIGKLYEAVQHYKRAIQILPDIETRLYPTTNAETRPQTPQETELDEPETEDEVLVSDDDEDSGDGDLLTRLNRIILKRGHLCQPAHTPKGGHISWLPYELILLILRWVVSSELDAMSLERVGAACRGLYVASRDPDIWRNLCVKTWGYNCGTPKGLGFGSWRQMYVERPHLRLHGCYISKTSYLRHGENSFQDQFYKPWFFIDYYRYLRFFPEGLVLVWTTAEEPLACVGLLNRRAFRQNHGIMAGHYRLIDNKVIIIVKRQPEKRLAQASNTRFRARRKDTQHEQGQTFQLELELRSVKSRRNWQLVWHGYSVLTRDVWTSFDLLPAKFPPFAFSGVRTYTAEADAPLA